jgi:hypothetical protein
MSKSIFYISLRMLWHPRRVQMVKGNSRSPRNWTIQMKTGNWN